jgi:hypothetical protein
MSQLFRDWKKLKICSRFAVKCGWDILMKNKRNKTTFDPPEMAKYEILPKAPQLNFTSSNLVVLKGQSLEWGNLEIGIDIE